MKHDQVRPVILGRRIRQAETLRVSFFVALLSVLLVGCAAPTQMPRPSATQTPGTTSTATPAPSATPTESPSPTPTATASPTATPTLSPTPSYEVSLAAVGDIMLARGLGGLIYVQGIEAPFAGSGVREALSAADLALGNLECALTERGAPEPKMYTFAAPPAGAQSLAWAGFDLVTLGNNHVLDYGVEGLEDTLRLLEEAGVGSVGAGMNAEQAAAPWIVERNGLRIAFLAFLDVPIGSYDYHQWEAGAQKPGIVWGRAAQVRQAVQAARQEADVVVALLHFGYEGVDYASPEQEWLAKTAIDAGAALVIGSHSHTLQPVVEYNGGLIAYSLGNFVFDDFEPQFNQSMILRVRLGKDGVLGWDSLAVEIVNGVPQVK